MIVGVPIRKVVRLGHPVLRAPARKLTPKEIAAPEVQRLIEEMAASMIEYEGVGIAANQVGEGVSLFLMGLAEGSPRHEDGIPLTVVFNPTVAFIGEQTEIDFEGCLSVDGWMALVPRAAAVRVEALNDKGEDVVILARGWHARILQHEIDHLHGGLCVDRMDPRTLSGHDNYSKFWRGKSVAEVRAALLAPRR